MSEDRFKESFRRIVSESPEPPEFSDLELHELTPRPALTFKPWMAAVGAAAFVMILVGAFGLLGGGGPDLASPDDDGLIDYIKLDYSASVEPVCEGGEIIDNGGFDEAIIEIWGPNSDDLILMVSTFPDGSTERMVVEGDPYQPKRAWGINPSSFEEETRFMVVSCKTTEESPGTVTTKSNHLLDPPYYPGFLPAEFLGPHGDYETWEDAYADPIFVKGAREWRGFEVIEYRLESSDPEGESRVSDFISFDDPTQKLGSYYEGTVASQGSTRTEIAVLEVDQVDANSIPFSTAGMFFIARPGAEFNQAPGDNCPVTIPIGNFTPPDTQPEHPAAWPDSVWYGSDDLWTVLSIDGSYQPRKSVWWSANFPGGGIENEPDITVRYTLLESRRQMTLVSDRGTNAHTPEEGWFMIAGIDAPIKGCWQVTANYKGTSLTYIYYNPHGVEPESIVVPDVVGLTVERARNVVHDAMYGFFFPDSANPSYEVCAQEPAPGTELNPWETVEMRTAPAGECGQEATPVPDVFGLTVAEARTALADAGYAVSVSMGVQESDVVCAQDPAPGLMLVKLDAAPPGECP